MPLASRLLPLWGTSLPSWRAGQSGEWPESSSGRGRDWRPTATPDSGRDPRPVSQGGGRGRFSACLSLRPPPTVPQKRFRPQCRQSLGSLPEGALPGHCPQNCRGAAQNGPCRAFVWCPDPGSRRLGGCCLSSAKEGERRWSQNVNTPACNTPGEWGTGCWGEQAPTALAAATEARAHARHPAASPGFILKQNLIQVMVTWSLFLTLPLRSCKSIRKAACRSGRAPALANPGVQVLSGRLCRAQIVQEPRVV